MSTPKIELRKYRHNVNGKEKFDSFDVWIDSKFYCSTRFSDFHSLSEKIAETFTDVELPKFPPKKINIPLLGMNDVELEERRSALEYYMKKLFEISEIHENPAVKKFFFDQREAFLDICSKEVEIKVYTMDDTFLTLKVKNSIKSEDLLKMACERLGVNEKYRSYFALFDVPVDSSEPETKMNSNLHPWYSIRRQEFSPSATIEILPPDLVTESTPVISKIYIKKWVFSNYKLSEMLRDTVSVKLLYLQAQADLKAKTLFPTAEERTQLRKFHLDNDMKEYVKLVRNVRGYFVTYLHPCKCNHPKEDSLVLLGISMNGIELHLLSPDGKRTGEEEVLSFPWEKIRRWKYSEEDKTYSFNYYFNQTTEKWIECNTAQYLLINSVIQEYVEELRRSMQSSGQVISNSTSDEKEKTEEKQKKEKDKEKEREKEKEKEDNDIKGFAGLGSMKTKPKVNENKIFSSALNDDDL